MAAPDRAAQTTEPLFVGLLTRFSSMLSGRWNTSEIKTARTRNPPNGTAVRAMLLRQVADLVTIERVGLSA